MGWSKFTIYQISYFQYLFYNFMQTKIVNLRIRVLNHILEICRRFKDMFFRRQAAEEKELERQAAWRLLHVASAINGFSAPSPFVFPEKNKDSRT